MFDAAGLSRRDSQFASVLLFLSIPSYFPCLPILRSPANFSKKPCGRLGDSRLAAFPARPVFEVTPIASARAARVNANFCLME